MNDNHHYLWIFFAFCVFGGVLSTYIFTVNRPDNYAKGSMHLEQHRQDWPFSIHIGEGGCASIPTKSEKKIEKPRPSK